MKTAKDKNTVTIQAVRSFWEANPLAASMIPYPLGTREYFEYYDRLREANESLEFSYWLHEYKRFARKKVLDVGSGNGYVLGKYAQEGAEVYGVDITEAGVNLCRQRFNHLGLQGDFRVANAEELPFEAETFDCVCSMGVLHHTPDTAKAVGEIFRVLKPAGRLIVMVYHRDSAKYRLKFPLVSLVSGKTIQQLVNEVDGAGNPKGNVYSESELRHLLSQFEQLSMFAGLLRGSHVLPKIGRFIPDSLLRPFEKKWGWFLYAKGVKPGN
ncbi:class I SAM-dependent methyltransferase [Candidatus Bipolaricaulota bacterium]|nr:class I SAM-dependent methyltransferase [Candidatus Bipolaricaulota bacterium]